MLPKKGEAAKGLLAENVLFMIAGCTYTYVKSWEQALEVETHV